MKISAEQLARFDEDARRSFIERLENQLREAHAPLVAGLPPQELRRRVLAGIARAQAAGLTWETTMAIYTVLMFELGPNFARQPAFARGLALRIPDEDERIRALFASTTDEDWEAAGAIGGDWADVRGPAG